MLCQSSASVSVQHLSLIKTPVVSHPLEEQRGVLLLEDINLWKQFNSITNEMIITKTGRCLFPSLKFKAVDLDPYGLYKIELDFEQILPERYKFRNDEWVAISNNDNSKHQPQSFQINSKKKPQSQCWTTREYVHPDSPQSGAYWIKNGVSFTKIKLTNRLESTTENKVLEKGTFMDYRKSTFDPELVLPEGYFPLKTFHRYRPRLHLIKLNQASHLVKTFLFEEASFIAVTHYQNNAVNQLKKQHNPHAKGFRVVEGGDTKQFSTRSRSLKHPATEEEVRMPKRFLTLSPQEKPGRYQKILSEHQIETDKKLIIKADPYGLAPLNQSKSVIQLPPPTPTVAPIASQPGLIPPPQQYEKSLLANHFNQFCISNTPSIPISTRMITRYSTLLPSIPQRLKSKSSENSASITQLPPLGTSYEDPILLTSKVSSAATSLLLLSDRPLHFGETRKSQGFTN
ncbi:hypothetical protein K7432_001279 [Basidiobolus ranarum]|uniref:T-box domain-containing protein n=1 Tax=Basidiobolus ranarum TaxID=34480 RepID=A0ABR2W9W3_9FUNG